MLECVLDYGGSEPIVPRGLFCIESVDGVIGFTDSEGYVVSKCAGVRYIGVVSRLVLRRCVCVGVVQGEEVV